jgi:L-serine dehydratase
VHISVLDFFTIGIGPSSSHTVGPMRAAARFAASIEDKPVARVSCDLYGSLAATGKGHGTDSAVILGLQGEQPETIEPERIPAMLERVSSEETLLLSGSRRIPFDESDQFAFHRLEPLPLHPNGMRFRAFNDLGHVIADETIYSIGGGFIATEAEIGQPDKEGVATVSWPYETCSQLLAHCRNAGLGISEITLANESSFRPESETRARLDGIWRAMQDCVKRGCENEGVLPGGLRLRRRARSLHEKLASANEAALTDPLAVLDWVDLYALAVNEENAAGGRVVTAPTNGGAGIIPAVLHYATRFRHSPHPDGVHRFLLTAGAIALLYKRNASIAAADVGCQGEVGVACSMAAGALVEFLGGSPQEVENAAEIGMEHNLGLTCDPVGGLVQIPCIERNAMGAVKAINAARLARREGGRHFVSLDKVIRTMRETGADMMEKYKETSRGGLAVSVVEC